MKRIISAFVLVVSSVVTHAQGYVGAVTSLTHIGFDCASSEGLTCDKSSQGWRFYAGSKLAPNHTLDFGVGKVDAVEVGYMRFGRAALNGGSRVVEVYDANSFSVVSVNQALSYVAEADATSVAAVAHVPLMNQFSLSARLGLAYVSSTFRTAVNGQSDSSTTQTKIKPYLGLGFEYDIPSIVKLVGSLDMTKYDAGGLSGTMRMIGLGAEKSF